MSFNTRIELLTIVAITVFVLQGNVACVRQTQPRLVSYDCRDHAQHGSRTPHELLRITNLDGLADVENQEQNMDDFHLSAMNRRALLKLIQSGKLKVVAIDVGDDMLEGEENAAQLEDFLQGKEEDNTHDDDDDDDDDGENEHRSKPKPWRKVQRIVRRQLIKVPKRYLKKFIRKIGLKRQLRATTRSGVGFDDFVALPMVDKPVTSMPSSVQEVGVLMRETDSQNGEAQYYLYQNK